MITKVSTCNTDKVYIYRKEDPEMKPLSKISVLEARVLELEIKERKRELALKAKEDARKERNEVVKVVALSLSVVMIPILAFILTVIYCKQLEVATIVALVTFLSWTAIVIPMKYI